MVVVVRLAVCVLLTYFYSVSVVALTDEEIERRFTQLEQENAALKEKLKKVDNILKAQGIDPENPLTERAVLAGPKVAGPKEVRAQTAAQRLDFAYQKMSDDLSRVKIQGFLSAGLSYNGESGGLAHRPYGYNNNADFNSDSALGLQIDFRINEKAKTVVQIVANGWEEWDPDIEWAYIAYDVSEQLSLRAGRMRLPFYLFSESLDVGYSYLWARPPLSLYTTEISNYDGFDATYWMRSGDVSHRISAFAGSYSFTEKDHSQDATVTGDDVFGLNWTTYWNDWTYRLSYAHLKNTANFEVETNRIYEQSYVNLNPTGPPLVQDRELVLREEVSEGIDYYSYAVSYDDGNWLAVFEAATLDVSEGNFIGDEVQGVATLGYHIGAFTPYIGFGREYYKNALDESNRYARTHDRDYKLSFMGLRYDITPGITAKLEWNHFYDFEGTTGPFENAEVFSLGRQLDEVDIYTFLIDAVF
jgi:opacity protein-like surface antigen